MTLKHKAPAGPRPANTSPRLTYTRSSSRVPTASSRSNSSVSNSPMLSTTSSNNHSHFSYGRNGQTSQAEQTITTTGSYDFLPSVSFDDLHTSIESVASGSDFRRSKYPSPAASRSDLESSLGMADRRMSDRAAAAANPSGSATRVGIPASSSRTTRSGSILHRPSASRQNSASSISTTSGSVDASTATIGVRTRRQNQYPPVSGSNIAAKPPRKSLGPGVVADAETVTRSASKRRPSLFSERAGDAARPSLDMGADTTRAFTTTAKGVKAKAVQQPSPVVSQTNILAGTSLTPEQHHAAPKSPRLGGKGSTPSSGRRASAMPAGHASHATGLGARTISPTDTRRMKRMSMMPQSVSVGQVSNVPPPPPVSMETRAASRSPSMIPRKASATPSSSRTTPDISRKSYSSGLSVGSTVSFNTVRTSTGSLQPRLSQSSSVSRLPAPKHTTAHGSLPSGDEEEVPPVPAIPKAFESPKDAPAETCFLARKKSSLGTLDSISINLSNSNSTVSVSVPAPVETVKLQRKPSAKSTPYAHAPARNDDKRNTQNKKSLEPLRLPPLNLGPLSIPTAAKVAALQEQGKVERNASTPASRQLPKTPTTPMTASKSSFFAKTRYDEIIEPLPPIRSSTSAHRSHRRTPSPPDATSSSSDNSLVFKDLGPKSSMSPFLSSSLPKGSDATNGFLKRSKTGSDHSHVNRSLFEEKTPQKPAGPRPPNTDKPVPKSPPPAPPAEQPQTPSSMSTLRRKLSLSWKKGNSRGAIVAPQDVVDKAQGLKQESVPPPRIPASATMNSLPTAKHSGQNASGPQPLSEPKRRKSSAASMHGTYVSHDRTKSDPWAAKKDVAAAADPATMPPARHPSVMAKLMRPKTSSSALPSSTSYIAEIDKDDVIAEEEMRKLGSRRKETEIAARTLDALKKRATPKERVGPHEAIRIAMLNIYERGEIIDYNDVYFCGTQNANKVVGDLSSDAPNFGYDDERGDYSIVIGDHLAYRYEVIDVLGKGSFGQVVRCIDHKLGVLVAVKIIRNKKRFHQQALVEVNILQKLREWDPHNRHSMVNFTQSFYFRGHLCISTELLDMNLYEFIKAHSFRGFSLRIIRRFTKQILSSLIILKQKKVIHCDLKPENILLRHPLHSEIKVIDFGSSCFESEKVYTYIQSRFYRSPEVILGMTYGLPIDMWSVGCILAELYTGVPIFPGENEQEQLACIMEVFGPPEKHLIEKSTRKKLFFDSMGKPRLTVSSKGRRRRPSSKTLQQVLKCDDDAFLDFIARCLRWDPDRRLKPEDAARHEFITGIKVPTPIPRLPMREASPVKRHNTISVSRPLPDPPGFSGKANVGASPGKPIPSSARRASGATAATTASLNRRTSAGTMGGGLTALTAASSTSSLPRAAGRIMSGTRDIAAAGATAAMNRRP
ncbi:cmgc dyrk dyrk2 kinase [Trichoderma cornu-damae]|uniref:dual-specificity kinase n=1 Tax=Trichoderma cornu-damae TaxID=654480 RepID=A0A9P8QTL3_9HYPO|nr:cmgc dyrk dyrk2 kinase [Trichoderma cornu-damae]